VVAVVSTGWRQGAILAGPEVEPFVRTSISDISTYDKGVFIVISQDCDVLNDKELFIEMVFATITKTPNDTGLMHGRSVRDLYLPCRDNHCYHMNINERVWVDSEVKERLQPNDNLSDELTNRLSGWLSFRYRREAFPDDFNITLKKAIESLRKKLSKLNNEHLIAIYLGIEPDRELEQGENYNVDILTVIADDTPDDSFNKYAEILDSFIIKANDSGVIFNPYGDNVVIFESEVTIADIRRLKKWHLEDISSRTKGTFSNADV